MQKTVLSKKGRWRAALIVLLLSVVGMGKGYARDYDFSEVCPSGQVMYYIITDEINHNVEVTCPGVVRHGFNELSFVESNRLDTLSKDPWPDPYSAPTGDLVLPQNVHYNGIDYSVTSIGVGVFMGCSGLISVEIPNSVTSIERGAFFYCSGLTSVTIPNSVTTIEESVFAYCSSLTSVTIPNSVTTIEWSVFGWCSSLTSVTIPNSVTTIEGAAFAYCNSLSSVTIPNSVTTIGGNAFGYCSSLTSVTIPNSVSTIEYGTFGYCSSLTSVTIPNSVSTIGGHAFYNCSGLTSVTIGKSVEWIRDGAFAGCPNIREINFNAEDCEMDVEEVWEGCSDIAFNVMDDVTYIVDTWWRGSDMLTSLSIGNSVVEIEDNAFRGCENLKTVNMGKSVASIGDETFSGCISLTSITIPQSVTFIGDGAFEECSRLTTIYYDAENADGYKPFSNCPNLTTIHIGADVKEIGSEIFKGCNTVHFVVALGPTPAVLDAGAFSDIVDNSVLMVSCGNRVTYYSVWNMFPFNNIIEDCNQYPVSVGVVGTGGNVTVSSTEVQMGQTVVITVTPNAGMVLSSISVVNANDPTQVIPVSPVGGKASNYSFVMPPFGVVVMATFMASGTSVGENSSIAAAVYPNPTNGQIKIEAEGLKHITISDMLGQRIYEGKANGNEFAYDLGRHGAGLYLVRIETAEGVATKRVVVTR